MPMSANARDIWIATSDGRDLIRADAIVIVRHDGGRLTAQLHDDARVTVTLVDGSAGPSPAADFHRELIRVVAELADTSEASVVRPHQDDHGWHWTTEPL
jgi:hypothetical protein